MAEALFNNLHPNDADSAGTIVDIPGQPIKERERAANAITVMKEIGLDISNNTRTQLTHEMLNKYDRIIVMAEPDTLPDYLVSSPKVEYWDIKDPAKMNMSDTRRIRDLISNKVKSLTE